MHSWELLLYSYWYFVFHIRKTSIITHYYFAIRWLYHCFTLILSTLTRAPIHSMCSTLTEKKTLYRRIAHQPPSSTHLEPAGAEPGRTYGNGSGKQFQK